MDEEHHITDDLLVELLIENGPAAMLTVFTAAYNMGMRVERGRFVGAGDATSAPTGAAPSPTATRPSASPPAETATLSVPKISSHGDMPFYPKALQRGRRCEQAVMAVAARIYFKGVSTRDVEDVLKEMGIEGMSATKSATRPRRSTVN